MCTGLLGFGSLMWATIRWEEGAMGDFVQKMALGGLALPRLVDGCVRWGFAATMCFGLGDLFYIFLGKLWDD